MKKPMKKRNFALVLVALAVISGVIVMGTQLAGPASAHPGYTCNPSPGHGNPGCHVDPTTTTAAPPSTTTTTAAPDTTTTTAAPDTTTTTAAPETTTTTAAPDTTTTTAAPDTTGTTLPTTTTTTVPAVPGFTDVPAGNPYHVAIRELARLGVISGFGDGTFRPADPITRQQFAKMIVKTLGYPVTPGGASPFADVSAQGSPSDPLYPARYIAVCSARGITTGKTAGLFAPYDYVSRAQLVMMVGRAAGLSDPSALLDGGIGVGSRLLMPASRGEVAMMLYNNLLRR